MLLFVLAATGCGGCKDPCAGVICPAGEVCRDGECVPDHTERRCSVDADCAGVQGRTRCDAVTGVCVECLVAAHCPNPERQICDPVEKFCAPRPPCESDQDCSDLLTSPRCDTESGKCVACITDAHCTGRQQHCHSGTGTCRFRPCANDDDCREYLDAPHCHVSSGLCQECTHDAQCGEHEICRQGLCLPRGECQRDSDCGVAERCNTVTQTCVQCIGTADCKLGGRCLSSICRPAYWCEYDGDCGAPLVCSAQTETCHHCTENAHCESGQVCEAGRCFGSQSCGPGVFCGPGEECKDGACSRFHCPADGYEAGQVPYEAAQSEPGRMEGISLCPNTWFWFVYDAALGDGLTVELTYEAVHDHPTLLLWTGTGTGAAMVGEPSITSTGQRLERNMLARSGPVWIGLRGVNEHLVASLDVDVVLGGLCEDDEYEPNHEPDLAVRLPDPVAGTTTIEAVACFGNEDWFYLPAPAGMRTEAVATTLDGGGNPLVVSLHVRGPGGSTILIGGEGTHQAEAGPREQAEDVYVRVANTTEGGRPYRLELTLRPPRPDNDDCDGAKPLLEGVPSSGTTAGAEDSTASGCGGEGSPDVVYSFVLDEPRTARVVTEGTLDTILSLRSTCEDLATELLCSDVPGDREEIEAALEPGEYYVWVANHEGREGDFEIRLETEEPPPPPLNDLCEEATPLDTSEGGGLEEGDVALGTDSFSPSCGAGGNDAFYLLYLDEPASLHAALEALPGMSISLREGQCPEDPSLELACGEAGDEGSAVLDLPYLEAGYHTLVVDGGGAGGGAYTLSWGLGTPVPPPANDDCDEAAPLDPSGGEATVEGDTTGASDAHEATCSAEGQSGPDVVYWLDLSEPSSLEARLHSDFDAVLELRGDECVSASASIACSDSTPASIFAPNLPAGTYHLIVDGYAGESGWFSLSVSTAEPLSPPANDLCEDAEHIDAQSAAVTVEGHTFFAGNDLEPPLGCTGSAAAGPDVVYSVDVSAGQTLTATVVPEEGYDPAIYVMESCDASTCVAGADDYFVSEPETVVFTAAESGTYFIAVDAWRAGEAGRFELTVSIE